MSETEHNVSRTAEGLDHFNTLQIPVYWIRLFDPFHVPMPSAPYRVTLGTKQHTGQADGEAWLKFRCLDPSMPCTMEWGKQDSLDGQEPDWNPGPPDPNAQTTPGQLIDLTVPDGAAEPSPRRDTVGRAETEEDAGGGSGQDDADGPNSSGDDRAPTVEPERSEYLYKMDVHLELIDHDSDQAIQRRLHHLGFDWYEDAASNIQAFQRIFDQSATGAIGDILDSLIPWHDECEPERWKAPKHAELCVQADGPTEDL
jgi:hypothetical protein